MLRLLYEAGWVSGQVLALWRREKCNSCAGKILLKMLSGFQIVTCTEGKDLNFTLLWVLEL
jgi:hypothetical protein